MEQSETKHLDDLMYTNTETLPFLYDPHTPQKPSKRSLTNLVCSTTWFRICSIIAITAAINIGVSFAVLTLYGGFTQPCGTYQDKLSSRYSPAQDVIEWESRNIASPPNQGPYSGDPSPEIDAAWSELMQGVNIKIYPEEMAKTGLKSLEFKDGSGFLGGLSVYHELHCIKMIRQWLYKDYYFPEMANASQEEKEDKWFHVLHCVDHLRQTASCRGDISVVPYTWLYIHNQTELGILGPTQADEEAEHRCINWDKLHAWTMERRINLFEYNETLLH